MERHDLHLSAVVLTFLFGIILPVTSNAQNINIPEGLGFEIGGGHNQLFWEATDPNTGNKTEANRTAFSIMPSIRISYNHQQFSKIGLYSFLGYNIFGGFSKLEPSVTISDANVRYKDQYQFKNFEAGLFGLYSISKVRMGIGAKINYHLRVDNKYYYENHPNGLNGWQTGDAAFFFKDWSMDAGLRVEYPVFQDLILGAESWFGLTDLSKNEFNDVNMLVRQNHFRLIAGFQF